MEIESEYDIATVHRTMETGNIVVSLQKFFARKKSDEMFFCN